MDTVIGFLQGLTGRLLRIVVGLALIVLGAFFIQGVWGVVIAVVGLVPLIVGLLGVCLIGPFFGYTLGGQKRSGLPHTS